MADTGNCGREDKTSEPSYSSMCIQDCFSKCCAWHTAPGGQEGVCLTHSSLANVQASLLLLALSTHNGSCNGRQGRPEMLDAKKAK